MNEGQQITVRGKINARIIFKIAISRFRNILEIVKRFILLPLRNVAVISLNFCSFFALQLLDKILSMCETIRILVTSSIYLHDIVYHQELVHFKVFGAFLMHIWILFISLFFTKRFLAWLCFEYKPLSQSYKSRYQI